MLCAISQSFIPAIPTALCHYDNVLSLDSKACTLENSVNKIHQTETKLSEIVKC